MMVREAVGCRLGELGLNRLYRDLYWYGDGDELYFQVYVESDFLELFRRDPVTGRWPRVCRIRFSDPDLFAKIEELLK